MNIKYFLKAYGNEQTNNVSIYIVPIVVYTMVSHWKKAGFLAEKNNWFSV